MQELPATLPGLLREVLPPGSSKEEQVQEESVSAERPEPDERKDRGKSARNLRGAFEGGKNP